MKVWIAIDELWPDYKLHREVEPGRSARTYEGKYEVPEDLVDKYEKAQEKFMELRRQIRDIHTGSDPI